MRQEVPAESKDNVPNPYIYIYIYTVNIADHFPRPTTTLYRSLYLGSNIFQSIILSLPKQTPFLKGSFTVGFILGRFTEVLLYIYMYTQVGGQFVRGCFDIPTTD